MGRQCRSAALEAAVHRTLQRSAAARRASSVANLFRGLSVACVFAVPLASLAAELPVACVSGACGVNGPASWITQGSANATIAGNSLTINQATSNATYNWQSFNISSDGSVEFKQPDASAIALNRIFQSDPSRIFGSLSANGRIYLLNQNGIVFGAGAQVNVGGLVASSLDITPQALEVGIARAGSRDAAAFTQRRGPDGKLLPAGDVTVEAGAKLSSPAGQILLFAPNVTNRGEIATPDGQTILAAGQSVYLAASDDPNVRGLLVEVGIDPPVDGQPASSVTNGEAANSTRSVNDLVGRISADRGNVTLAGFAVNQLGRVTATTSVRANGSVRLLARGAVRPALPPDSGDLRGGDLVIGSNSLTQVALDADSSTTVDVNTQPRSQIEMSGRNVTLRSDAMVQAHAGNIEITAASQPGVPVDNYTPEPDDSRILIESGAKLDVSGVSVDLPVERNSLRVELRGSQFADSPLQRDGALRGQAVYVDIRTSGTRADGSTWQGTPVGDVSGDIGLIARNVSERSLAGGSVTLTSQGAVMLAQNSGVDLSGGQINWQAGYVRTTQVLGADGVIYDIGAADRDRIYVGTVDQRTVHDQRWGTSATYTLYGSADRGRYEAGYVEGKDAGTLSIVAPRAIVDGQVVANTTIGSQQRLPATTFATGLYRPYNQLPLGAQLSLGLQPQTGTNYLMGDVTVDRGPLLSEIHLPDGSAFDPHTQTLPSEFITTWLRPDLFGEDAITRLRVFANGEFKLPATTVLNLPGGSSLQVTAGRVDVRGSVRSPGGTVE
ncbi:MAG TPA: filamentous hemagglutinin N-terminal domain-containing protein, partial [Povalibacter sp.]|nr:filamentous hemagglutinin N-terminal domain-containing protein [Povalibacter sp.]